MDKINKRRVMQDMVDTATKPLPSLEQVQNQAGTMVQDAKKAVLQKLMGKEQQPFNPRTQENAPIMAGKAASAINSSKQQEANNVINRLQNEIGDLESMAQFGDPDATKQIEMKKEVLRRYLLNNR